MMCSQAWNGETFYFSNLGEYVLKLKSIFHFQAQSGGVFKKTLLLTVISFPFSLQSNHRGEKDWFLLYGYLKHQVQ